MVVKVEEDGGLSQKGSVVLNVNLSAGDIDQPDGVPTSILTQELYQPDITGRQVTTYESTLANPEVVPVSELETPRIEYPRIEYPRIEYPRIEYTSPENPRIEYPRIEYIAPETPRIEYPRIEYPRIEYSATENPRIEYPRIEYSALVTEITWPVTTSTGDPATSANTTTAMTAKAFVNGGLPTGTEAQVLVTVPYLTGVANSCSPGDSGPIVDNQVIVNTIVDPANLAATLVPPDVVNPPSWQPSFPVKPGQTVWVTLRIRGINGTAGEQLARRAGLWVRSQPDPTMSDELDEHLDGAAPVIVGVPTNMTVEATSSAGAVVSYTPPTASNLGQAVAVTCSATPGSTFPIGTSTVTCTAGGPDNMASESFTVTVRDTTPPALSGVPGDMTVEANVLGGATVSFTPSATDLVDGSVPVVCVPPSGSVFPVGSATKVTCTAADALGHSTSASFNVTVTDTTAPVFDLGSLAAGLNVQGNAPGGAHVSFTITATDVADGPLPVNCGSHPPTGSFFPLGSTGVACSATDSAGTTATAGFTVTVVDTTAPVFTTPEGTLLATVQATGPLGAVVTYVAPGATDVVDAGPVVSCTPPSGSTFSVGTHSITCTATDASTNSASRVFSVAVVDTTAPILTVPDNITKEATGPNGAAVAYSVTASDLVDSAVAVNCTPASGSTFTLGATAVSCSATDRYGNSTSNGFTVTVVDTTPPALTVPGNVTADSTSAAGAVVSYTAATAMDLVDANPSVGCKPPSGSTFPVGTTTVTCTATDASGNSTTKQFTVTVVDKTPPIIVEAATPTVLILVAQQDHDAREGVRQHHRCDDGDRHVCRRGRVQDLQQLRADSPGRQPGWQLLVLVHGVARSVAEW